MRWKLKAAIQNAIASLPAPLSYAVYYRMQRLVGGLKQTDPVDRLVAGVDTWRRIVAQGCDPVDRTFFEVGTGRTPMVPLAYWLMGARRTITVDLNPYLKGELIHESLKYIEANQGDIAALFGELLQRTRFDSLLQLARRPSIPLPDFLSLCCIDYVAPGDARKTGLPPGSIDFHTSFTVFEHIPAEVLAAILEEGNRIVSDAGLFVHMVDYSDHFSHADDAISAVNFLRYSDAEWATYAQNRYMFMNRLRHDDFLELFTAAGHRILATAPSVDERARDLLVAGGLPLDRRFAGKPVEILAIRDSWIVSQTCAQVGPPGSDADARRPVASAQGA